VERAADDPLEVHPQQVGGRPVDAQHPLPGVDRQHALDHASQHRLLLRALPADGQAALHELLAEQAEGAGDVGQFRQPGRGQRGVDPPGGQLRGGVPQFEHRPGGPAGEEVAGGERRGPAGERAGQ
jgi:hypothetical protein